MPAELHFKETDGSENGQCDNYNLKSHRRCNNIVSYEFLSIRRTCDYIESNVRDCVLFSSRISVRIRFSVGLLSCYAHEFVLPYFRL